MRQVNQEKRNLEMSRKSAQVSRDEERTAVLVHETHERIVSLPSVDRAVALVVALPIRNSSSSGHSNLTQTRTGNSTVESC